ncbi:hypothetical protein [Streptomyces xantholiticus]|uniref:hypothetical protein n=1 Tax=Streptomyces xantholiticus TaxID=68285 RepID=UPI00167AA46B|nr:hypothetical protein [Streptomyces xantholiticus]GGW66015.1 hypothetical protein GCM10010381_58770 [Streptomyces xantholiticus]
MAEDDGTGRPVYGPPMPKPSAPSGGGSGKDLDVDAGELQAFKARVDKLLIRLEASPAAPSKLADGEIAEGDIGVEFDEAKAFFGIYKKVHAELKNLSKGLAGQIEGLSIAVTGASKGFQNIEDDLKLRMNRIYADAQATVDRREQERREAERPTGDDKPKGETGQGDTSGGTDF